MIELREMNRKKIRWFYSSVNCHESDALIQYYLQVETETGHMANITHYYIVGEVNSEETERWNFHNVDGVTWAIDD